MSDELAAKLIVMETGPRITLAAADSLDYLLYPGVPVYIPDAVLYEATRDSAALGAAEILDWAQRNADEVRTISTETFFNYIESREANPARREKILVNVPPSRPSTTPSNNLAPTMPRAILVPRMIACYGACWCSRRN